MSTRTGRPPDQRAATAAGIVSKDRNEGFACLTGVPAGSKTFTSDDHPDGGHGSIIGRSRAEFGHINEEHGYIDVSALSERPAVGRHLQIVPNHACGCMNLHDGVLAVRDGVVDHVIRVAGRGLIR